MVKPNLAKSEAPGMKACYRKAPQTRGFPTSGVAPRQLEFSEILIYLRSEI